MNAILKNIKDRKVLLSNGPSNFSTKYPGGTRKLE